MIYSFELCWFIFCVLICSTHPLLITQRGKEFVFTLFATIYMGSFPNIMNDSMLLMYFLNVQEGLCIYTGVEELYMEEIFYRNNENHSKLRH